MIHGLVPPLPVKSESVDVVVADQVIEHMPTFRDALNLLSECRRVLGKSGFLVLGFPDYIRMGLVFYDRDYSHSFLTTENRVNQILLDSGFEPVKIIRFSGSVSNRLATLLLDVFMLAVNARLTCLLGDSFGVSGLLYRVRKTFGASTVIFAQKKTGRKN
jgi:SAM-dependent methyltransferase